jgi:hypothetical protein
METKHAGNWTQIRVSRPISRTIGIIAAERRKTKYEVVENAIEQAYPEYGNR